MMRRWTVRSVSRQFLQVASELGAFAGMAIVDRRDGASFFPPRRRLPIRSSFLSKCPTSDLDNVSMVDINEHEFASNVAFRGFKEVENGPTKTIRRYSMGSVKFPFVVGDGGESGSRKEIRPIFPQPCCRDFITFLWRRPPSLSSRSSSRWNPLVLSGVEVSGGETSLSSSSVPGDKMSLSPCFLFFTRFLDVDRFVTC